MTSTEDVRQRLAAIAEELGDLALDELRRAVDDRDGATTGRAGVTERRLTRARRAVEKAVHLLDEVDGVDRDDDE